MGTDWHKDADGREGVCVRTAPSTQSIHHMHALMLCVAVCYTIVGYAKR